MKRKVEQGDLVQDKITSYKGITVGKATYLTGCDQFLVQPACSEDAEDTYPVSQWLDEGRLTVLDIGVMTKEVIQSDSGEGCDYSAPHK